MGQIREYMESIQAECVNAPELADRTMAEFGYGLVDKNAILELAYQIIASHVVATLNTTD